MDKISFWISITISERILEKSSTLNDNPLGTQRLIFWRKSLRNTWKPPGWILERFSQDILRKITWRFFKKFREDWLEQQKSKPLKMFYKNYKKILKINLVDIFSTYSDWVWKKIMEKILKMSFEKFIRNTEIKTEVISAEISVWIFW